MDGISTGEMFKEEMNMKTRELECQRDPRLQCRSLCSSPAAACCWRATHSLRRGARRSSPMSMPFPAFEQTGLCSNAANGCLSERRSFDVVFAYFFVLKREVLSHSFRIRTCRGQNRERRRICWTSPSSHFVITHVSCKMQTDDSCPW